MQGARAGGREGVGEGGRGTRLERRAISGAGLRGEPGPPQTIPGLSTLLLNTFHELLHTWGFSGNL